MGFVDRMVEKGIRIIKDRLRKEYEGAGSAARTEMETISLEEAAHLGKMFGDFATGIWGGQIKPEGLWVLRLENQGLLHWYIQPFTKMTLLPGEHHAVLAGGASATTGLERGVEFFAKPLWWSDDEGLASALNDDAALRKICKKVRWTWEVQGGARIEYESPLQFRSVGNARTHVALSSGNYGRSRVGFQVFLDICRGLTPHLDDQADYPEGAFRTPYAYSQIALSELQELDPT